MTRETVTREALKAIQKMMAQDAENTALDVMLYGRSVMVITADGVHRVPPEDWRALANDIVITRRQGNLKMTVAIEKNIPVPTKYQTGVYPWDTMEVGDAFATPSHCKPQS